MDKNIEEQVEVLLEYLFINNKIKKADVILGLGSIDYKVAEKCAELYKQGYGKYIIFTGNCGKGTKGIITKTEAENFKNIALNKGVPDKKIYLEKKATTTWENFIYSKSLMIKNNLNPKSIIVVQKPYAERRSYAISGKFYTDKDIFVTSPDFNIQHFVEYYEDIKENNLSDIICEIVAEINILEEFSKYDMLIPQKIPTKVKIAYNYLVNRGYTKYLFDENKVKTKVSKINKLLEYEN